MVQLFGREMSRAQIAASAGALSQFAGVRLMTLGDGLERGIRLLEFRSGSGLRFTVLVDRAMDIADLDHKGRSVGWHSPTGFRSAALHSPEAEDGFSWTRSFSGFLATCGLDHILGPQRVSTHAVEVAMQGVSAPAESGVPLPPPLPPLQPLLQLGARSYMSRTRRSRRTCRRTILREFLNHTDRTSPSGAPRARGGADALVAARSAASRGPCVHAARLQQRALANVIQQASAPTGRDRNCAHPHLR